MFYFDFLQSRDLQTTGVERHCELTAIERGCFALILIVILVIVEAPTIDFSSISRFCSAGRVLIIGEFPITRLSEPDLTLAYPRLLSENA